MSIVYDTNWGYQFKEVEGNLNVLDCFNVRTSTKVGRLHLGENKTWILGISIYAKYLPSSQQQINLTKWANARINRSKKERLKKGTTENGNTSTMDAY